MRPPVDDAEKASVVARLSSARSLMSQALTMLDDTPVATDCDAHLDLAIHKLSQAIEAVESNAAVLL